MPPAVPCPTCHSPLTVREAQLVQLVTCPACHNPLVVMRPARVPAHLDPSAADEPEPEGLVRWA